MISLSLIIIIIIIIISTTHLTTGSNQPDPTPTPWPLQFHSILSMNLSKGTLQIVDLYYDFPNGRNFQIIQYQLGKKLYDIEWNNGTSFYYTLDVNKECKVRHFDVGILRPNWLDGATYLGQVVKDGFLCNFWTKVDFIWYYEDVVTKSPVAWTFYSGVKAHVMTFEVGKVLDDPGWQAPVYCFEEKKKEMKTMLDSPGSFPLERRLMRELTGSSSLI